LLYKAVAAAAHLLGGALVLLVARALGASRSQSLASALVFLWNPLLLWEMVGNGHNDGLMMLGALLAIWLLVRGRQRLALPALALGALVKPPVVVIAPLLALPGWRCRRREAIEGVCLALLLALILYYPFWRGLDTLTALRRTELFTASLGSVLRLSLAPSLGLVVASSLARWTSLAGFGAVAAVALFRTFRARQPREVVGAAYVTLLAATLLATTWFQAWYVVWPLALGAALPDGRRHLEVGLLSLGGLLQYLVFIYLWVMGVFAPHEDLPVQAGAYLAIVGPLLLGVALWQRARYARR
ncbi:MAG: hypothetical protein M3336_10885, partial [Chloroflexota bacterium]|nr:hypothetical protein [Chloroflexota bacterium]